jgi:hypothetical protein
MFPKFGSYRTGVGQVLEVQRGGAKTEPNTENTRPVSLGPRLLCSVVYRLACFCQGGASGQSGHGGILRFCKAATFPQSIVGWAVLRPPPHLLFL